jgi:hypothetical protein
MRKQAMAAMAVVFVLHALSGAMASERSVVMGKERSDIPTGRAQLTEWLDAAREERSANPEDVDAAMRLARLTYEAGDFDGAWGLLNGLVAGSDPDVKALMLAARTEYLLGHYDRAEELLGRVLANEPDDSSALRLLALVYYQTNRYDKCRALPLVAENVRFPHLDLMLAFDDQPYRAEWQTGDETEVPFLATDPLPVVEVVVNGRRVTALIDTGGDTFVLDPGVAEELGIEIVASMTGMFAGGMEAEVGLARAKSLRLGGVTLRSVPIAVLPTASMELGGHRLEGIVGTQVLKQFVSTLDYPNGRLVLRDPGGETAAAFREGHAERVLDEVPFYLDSTHFLLAHGSLNGFDGLLFHVDSGLAGEPAFAAPRQTLEYVGIPVPEVEVRGDVIGGGGGGFATGTFSIAELGLGDLLQSDLVGSFGSLPPQSFMMHGFIQDGLISHNFLRAYSWTLDFDRMMMVFAE